MHKNNLRLRLKLGDARTGRELKRVEFAGNMTNLTLFQDGLLPKLLQLLELPAMAEAEHEINNGGTAMPGAYFLFLKGRGLFHKSEAGENIERVIGFLEKALRQDDRYLQARLVLAEAFLSSYRLAGDAGRLQKALEHGRRAKAIAGPWLPAQLVWAMLLKANGQKSEALQVLQEVLKQNRRSYQACIELANAYSAANRASEAEELFKRAISLRPGYPPAYHNLAYFFDLHGRLDEALSQYQKQAELAPGDFNCLTNMGMDYVLKGDKDSAKSMFERSIAIQTNAVAQSNLATLYFYEGNYPKALPLFKEAASKSSNCWAWGNLADTYRQIPEHRHDAGAAYQKAISLAEADLQTNPENSALLSCLAMYYAYRARKPRPWRPYPAPAFWPPPTRRRSAGPSWFMKQSRSVFWRLTHCASSVNGWAAWKRSKRNPTWQTCAATRSI